MVAHVATTAPGEEWKITMKPEQQDDLDKVEQEFLERFLRTVSNLAKNPGKLNTANYGRAMGEDTPFLFYCSILRQEKIVKALQEESTKTSTLLTATKAAVDAMQKDSSRIKWLTGVLVFLTIALVVLTVTIWQGT